MFSSIKCKKLINLFFFTAQEESLILKRIVQLICVVLISFLFVAKPQATDISSDKESYNAYLSLPEGSEPFPVIALSHGAGGLKGTLYVWAKKFTAWGFATIVLDHYAPRGFGSYNRMGTQDSFEYRRDDLISILKIIKNDQRFDDEKVTLAGWSRGAGFVGHGIMDEEVREEANFEHPIKAAVLFYPQNNTFFRNFDEEFNLPVILLMGSEDYIWVHGWKSQWTEYKSKIHPLVLKVYEGATHLFDAEKILRKRCRQSEYDMHCFQYDAVAHKQSIKDLKTFLTKYAK